MWTSVAHCKECVPHAEDSDAAAPGFHPSASFAPDLLDPTNGVFHCDSPNCESLVWMESFISRSATRNATLRVRS
jgi:hypothetical protein